MTPVIQIKTTDIIIFSVALYIIRILIRGRQKGYTTPLTGPPSKSLIFGLSRYLNSIDDPGKVMEDWAAEHGSVYKIPTVFGGTKVVICDPRAIRDFYSKETFTYVGTPLAKTFIAKVFGRGLLWAEGESHKRQRKALTPAFSNAAIRRLTSVFYDSSYKLKTHWDTELLNHPKGLVMDVQNWMNHISLDSIGIAGFSHDFGSLDGKSSAVVEAFESLGSTKPSAFGTIIFLLSFVFPFLNNLPTKRQRMLMALKKSMRDIADVLLERTRKSGAEDKSIIGLLIKAESANGELHMTEEEVLAQNVLLLAGYETTSISLTWALIELAKQPEKQTRLRKELLEGAGGTDPTWDRLMGPEFPYLDAVVHEILRMHPPLSETNRVATENDILPLSVPFTTADGKVVDSIAVAKGTTVAAPIRCVNRAEAVWGPRAKEFIPERWLGFSEDEKEKGDVRVEWQAKEKIWGEDGIPPTVREIQGHKHLLTFSDGPRTCLGKGFALAEFKAALSVLIRNYQFSFDDPDVKIGLQRAILPRPKVEGCDGAKVPMRVRRVE
ncbi:cytochrome p450 [Moniliophthora roreri MCA 2997]|uniref:Cytochrome p450 n=1 Tax=Moniliophthora roreri (strain MCA 2997) TaxID=1381753 RepID=V2XSX2_MONRO|nr:cytochrome p450 [Moniliophthora roreri MCA 2997]